MYLLMRFGACRWKHVGIVSDSTELFDVLERSRIAKEEYEKYKSELIGVEARESETQRDIDVTRVRIALQENLLNEVCSGESIASMEEQIRVQCAKKSGLLSTLSELISADAKRLSEPENIKVEYESRDVRTHIAHSKVVYGELSRSIEEKKNQLANLNTQRECVGAQRDLIRQRIDAVKKSIALVGIENRNLHNANETYRLEAEKTKCLIRARNEGFLIARAKATEMETQITNLKASLGALNKQIRAHTFRIDQTGEASLNLEKHIDQVRSRVSGLSQIIVAQSAEKTKLVAVLLTLESEAHKSRIALAQSFQAKSLLEMKLNRKISEEIALKNETANLASLASCQHVHLANMLLTATQLDAEKELIIKDIFELRLRLQASKATEEQNLKLTTEIEEINIKILQTELKSKNVHPWTNVRETSPDLFEEIMKLNRLTKEAIWLQDQVVLERKKLVEGEKVLRQFEKPHVTFTDVEILIGKFRQQKLDIEHMEKLRAHWQANNSS